MSTVSTTAPRAVAAPEVRIAETIPLLEDILVPWQSRIGADYPGYRNHVYRVLHCCFALRDCSDEEREILIIAGAFHDIGIWSDHTVDYLPPSIEQARLYLEGSGLGAWVPDVSVIIDQHHKLRPYRAHALAETFRQADLADFSLGLMRGGVPAGTIRALKAAFPNAGFHRRLLQLAGGWFSQHPFSPPPFMKW